MQQPHEILTDEIKSYADRLDSACRTGDAIAIAAYAQALLALKRVAGLMRQDAAKAEAGGGR